MSISPPAFPFARNPFPMSGSSTLPGTPWAPKMDGLAKQFIARPVVRETTISAGPCGKRESSVRNRRTLVPNRLHQRRAWVEWC